jgi:hypothetical protein
MWVAQRNVGDRTLGKAQKSGNSSSYLLQFGRCYDININLIRGTRVKDTLGIN